MAEHTHKQTQVSQKVEPASPAASLRRACACGQHTAGGVCTSCQTARSGGAQAPSIVHDALRAPGQPLDSHARAALEPRFDHDFSQVRVHTDSQAARSAHAVQAHAYTVGRHIVFGAGQYAPQTSQGQRLLAHELTHVAQQRSVRNPQYQRIPIGATSDHFERQATRHTPASMLSSTPGPRLQRVPFGETLARFFGEGTFSEQELEDYLRFLDTQQRIEDHFDSDNKARAVVRRWQSGDSRYILPVQRKILLIREMLKDFTGDDDEQAILLLLRGATDSELTTILTTIGRAEIESNFQGDERRQLDDLLTQRAPASQTGGAQTAGQQPAGVFSAETILPLQRRFTSNAEDTNRLNCILIIRELAPQLFGQDPQLAQQVTNRLNALTGPQLKMTEVGRVLSDLGLVEASAQIRFNNGNGNREPTAMNGSAWDTIIGMVGNVQGWHVFGLAVFDGYHSVTVLVDNRADGPRLYWADQWRIDPGDDFHEQAGSVSGFRRYEQSGFDQFLSEYTISRWNSVFAEKNRRYSTTLHIWKFRSRLVAQPGQRRP